jgi:hypothetical protein
MMGSFAELETAGVFAMTLSLLLCATPAAAGCDVHAGDDLLSWVNTSAGQLSRELAEADYNDRFPNNFMQSLDDVHDRISKIEERLKAARDHIQSAETLSQGALECMT